MQLKTPEVIIDPQNPFLNCKLERKRYADSLTSIVGKNVDGFVMALNSEWGTGKTTFLKMWQAQLKLKGYSTVYFNAWENDFEESALTAITAELKSLTTSENKPAYDELLKKGLVLFKNIAPNIIKAAVKKYTGMDDLAEFTHDSVTAVSDIFTEDINAYLNKKEGIKEFKQQLSNFISQTVKKKPLIFIVDELDRCRPNYAVSVLEQIKHFFSIEGIIFVLAIDKHQLSAAIKGVYNSSEINASEYLRRFIDIEFILPLPEKDDFVNSLLQLYDFTAFFNSNERRQYGDFNYDFDSFCAMTKILFSINSISIRTQHKLLAQCRLLLGSFAPANFLYPEMFLYLVYIKNMLPNHYSDLRHKKISVEEALNTFTKIFNENDINDDNRSYILYLEGYLIFFYYNYLNDKWNDSILSQDENQNPILKVNSKLESDSSTLLRMLKSLQGRNFKTKISYLLNKIDLLN